jgi:hypothetical protein
VTVEKRQGTEARFEKRRDDVRTKGLKGWGLVG